MPPDDARLLDIRTSPIDERIAAAADFLDAGYEVHFNLSPVVLRPGWQRDWADLLTHLDDVLPARVKEQAAAEVIMLTHNQALHEVNLGWHPRAEDVAVAAGHPGDEALAERRPQRPLRPGHQATVPDPPPQTACGARTLASRPVRLLSP